MLSFCLILEIGEEVLHRVRLEVLSDGLSNVNRCVAHEELVELLRLLLLVRDLVRKLLVELGLHDVVRSVVQLPLLPLDLVVGLRLYGHLA